MRDAMKAVVLGAAVLAAVAVPGGTAEGQFLKKLEKAAKDRAKQQAAAAATRKVEGGVDRAVNSAEAAITCLVTDSACRERAEAEGKPVSLVDEQGAAVAAPASAGAAAAPAAFVNFDFVPGTTPLYVDDFAKDRVGDFPKRLDFRSGNYEVAELGGTRFLRGTSFGEFAIVLPQELPERFTLEFEFTGSGGWYQEIFFVGDKSARMSKTNVTFRPGDGGLEQPRAVSNMKEDPQDAPFPVRIMADGRYVKVYLGGTRVANVPKADLGRTREIVFSVSASEDSPALFGNFRVMAGGRDLYDALAAEGRVATQGIYFETGSDRLRPESKPTLEEIAAMLGEHADLALRIEGHTDDVGDAAANLTLSERRAAAVRQALVAQFGVDGSRLTTQGLGETKPAQPNASAEGRAANRRVELVRTS